MAAFGSGDDCDARLTGFAVTSDGAEVSATLHGRPLTFPIRQTGTQWGLNSLAVLLTCEALDVALDTSLAALAAFAPLEGRGADRVIHSTAGDFTLIDDSFNANSLSLGAALATLGARPAAGRRIVALTDMLELGDVGPALHAALAEPIAKAKVDLVFCAGPLMQSLWESLPPTRRGGYANTADDLAPAHASCARPGTWCWLRARRARKPLRWPRPWRALDVGRKMV